MSTERILDVSRALSSDQLEALRARYDRRALSDDATEAVARKYPEAADLVRTIQRLLFKDLEDGGEPALPLPPARREAILVALMVAGRTRGELAIHVYWALMEDLDPQELAAIVVLVGAYEGLDVMNAGLTVMQSTLQRLRECVERGETSMREVVGALLEGN